MVREIIRDLVPGMLPLIIFVSIVLISLRLTYLKGNRKFVFHKEILMLICVVYILCLYQVVTMQDINYGGINLIPFKEMFRYDVGSYKFVKNIVGNILLFIPYGFFSSYYLNNKKIGTNITLCFIATFTIEVIQYYIGRVFDIDDIILNIVGGLIGCLGYIALMAIKENLPKFMKSDWFLNLLFIVLIILGVLYGFNINIFDYI